MNYLYDANTPIKQIIKIFNSVKKTFVINPSGLQVASGHNPIGWGKRNNRDGNLHGQVLKFSYGGWLYQGKLYLSRKSILSERVCLV